MRLLSARTPKRRVTGRSLSRNRLLGSALPFLSMSEAARLAGIDRRILQRQIARGTVSVTAAADGT